MSKFEIQVTGNWLGTSGAWRAALLPGESEPQTFDTREEVEIVFENVILPLVRAEQEQAGIDWAAGDQDLRDHAPSFRIRGDDGVDRLLNS